MENFYMQYSDTNNIPGTTTSNYDSYTINPTTYTGGYVCPHCGEWVQYGSTHQCCDNYIIPWYTGTLCYLPENKTEKAYNVLKKLVEIGTIPEPDTYKKFCKLIEGIAKIL